MKYILLFFVIAFALPISAQLNDHTWFISLPAYGIAKIDFNYDPVQVHLMEQVSSFSFTNASFSDNDGNFLYHTNGLQVYNQLYEVMENGDSINAGNMADQHANIGYSVFRGAFFLPVPGDSSTCFMFHMFKEELPTVGYTNQKLLYTKIDRTANNGLGKVIEKNIPLLVGDETLGFHHASTVRHANGRDWWIVVPNQLEPIYYRFLLTPYGIERPETQEVGYPLNQPILYPYDHLGINLFSQDGSRYIDYDTFKGEGFQLFDFDRCTGQLSNPIKIELDSGFSPNNFGGAAFSPSGRFLYLVYRKDYKYRLVQYDIEAPDIETSEVLLSECPSPPISPYECSFALPVLAPDNKIYVGAKVDSTSYHIIHYPDSLGLACGFEFGGLEIGISPVSIPPYFPNYRLYDVPGSPCDTLGIDAPVGTVAMEEQREQAELDIYPNPSGGEVNIRYGLSGKDGQVEVFNVQGQKVRGLGLPTGGDEVHISGLKAGIYFVRVLVDGYVQKTGKVVVH